MASHVERGLLPLISAAKCLLDGSWWCITGRNPGDRRVASVARPETRFIIITRRLHPDDVNKTSGYAVPCAPPLSCPSVNTLFGVGVGRGRRVGYTSFKSAETFDRCGVVIYWIESQKYTQIIFWFSILFVCRYQG